jgi:hypothetical protein
MSRQTAKCLFPLIIIIIIVETPKRNHVHSPVSPYTHTHTRVNFHKDTYIVLSHTVAYL